MTDQYETDRRQQDPDQPMAEARVPMFNVPTVILVLIGLFALVHFGRSLLTPGQDLTFLIEMAFIPARYVDGLLASGLAGFTSFVTYNFLHGDVTHLGVNSIWMLAMGSAVAKRLGAWRFLAFSLVCSLFAAFAHLLTHWGELVPVIGASGAVSGHMAAAIRFIFSVPDHGHVNEEGRGELWAVPMKTLTETLKDSRVLGVLAIWLLMNILSGIGVLSMGQGDNPIAWEAHIGGFLAGLLLFSLFDHPKEPIDPTFDQNRGSS
ncbi:MAG: rhomboid family intramembrane serine protease [Hyphomicrobiaceae bacterium]|nr:rhomboid family intramembrane serine protease [Hyphomicrobiaceae bacterium]